MKGIEASQLPMTTLVLGVDSMVKRFKRDFCPKVANHTIEQAEKRYIW